MNLAHAAILSFLLLLTSACLARDVSDLNPPFPRIGNCYGAGLGWRQWDEGAEYWSKLDLFVGGCYDLHYDWEHERWQRVLARLEENIPKLRQVNPTALVLPYVDVIEGPDNPNVPQHWWDLRDGERWSGWPGYYRINVKLPEVLQFNLDKVREEVMGREIFDGVFYDCWHPDEWLVPRTAALRDGKAVVMLNQWNLPTTGFEHLNGCLAEDELNRVVEGRVDFEDFLARYLRWSTQSRKPVVTMIVCHPREMDMDAWRWHEVPREERRKIQESLEKADPQMVRFGLTTTLLGDGYFGYDCANLGRGNWWWYPEYDAPLGHPKGPAQRAEDGTWRRDFDGGTVVVNGSEYDAVVDLGGNYRDFSTGRVGRRFTLPVFDGRIFVSTDEPETPGEDVAPRLTQGPPSALKTTALDDLTVVQTPGGLELRFEPTGELRRILWHGRQAMTGGWPVVASPPMTYFQVQDSAAPEQQTTPEEAGLTFAGTLVDKAQRVAFTETCTVRADDRFTLRFDCEAKTDLNLRMWRHYFFFPVSQYAGATARAGDQSLVLPDTFGEERLLPSAGKVEVQTRDLVIAVESSLPLGLVDHRKWGSEDYLLAGYPVGGEVKQGTKWSVEITVSLRAAE